MYVPRRRFGTALAVTMTVHAALAGALIQVPVHEEASPAVTQQIAMVDLVEPRERPEPPRKQAAAKPASSETVPPKPQPKVEKVPPPELPQPEESQPQAAEVVAEELPPIPPEPMDRTEHPAPERIEQPPAEPSAAARRRQVRESYLGRLRYKIQSCLHYPMMARRPGLEGESLLRFTVERDGSVARIALEHSSGHRSLDERAVRTVRDAAPFEAPPEGEAMELVLPVAFSLEPQPKTTTAEPS
jgi:periplasmic protein TonB